MKSNENNKYLQNKTLASCAMIKDKNPPPIKLNKYEEHFSYKDQTGS